MARWSSYAVVLATMCSSTSALAADIPPSPPPPPPPAVRVAVVDWSSIEAGTRVGPGEALITPRVLTGFELSPASASSTAMEGRALRGMSGEVGLAEGLTLRLAGYDDFFGVASSGTFALAWWFLPAWSPLQLSLSGGFTEGSSPALSGRAAFVQAGGTMHVGAFEMAGSARAFASSYSVVQRSRWDTRGGFAWRSGLLRIGAEGLMDARGPRASGVSPFVSATTSEGAQIRIAPTFRPKSRSTAITVGGHF